MSTESPTLELAVIPPDLAKAVADTRLSADSAKAVCVSFAPHFSLANQLLEESKLIAVNAPKAANAMRVKLKKVRCAAENLREDLVEDANRTSKSINGINGILKKRLEAEEDRLEEIEKAEEIAAKARVEKLQAERETVLKQYTNPQHYSLGMMTEQTWTELLSLHKGLHERKAAEAAKAEADRVEKEKADAEAQAKKDAEDAAERERLKVENDRLAKEAEEQRKAREEAERVAAEKLQRAEEAAQKEREAAAFLAKQQKEKDDAKAAQEKAERDARDKKAAEEKAEAERKAAAELKAVQDKAEQDRKAAEEKAAAEKAEADRIAAEEREKREKVEAELAAQKKAEDDRIAAAEKARKAAIAREKAAAKKAAAAPDKDKLKVFAQGIRDIPLPTLQTEESKEVISDVLRLLNVVADDLDISADHIGEENNLFTDK